MDRRQFLTRAAGLAALSSSSASAVRGAQAGKAAPPDSARIRAWASRLRGQVVVPGDRTYDSDRRVWNLAVDRRPAAIVRCAEVQDVVKAIDFARTHAIVVAVRSGGHGQAGHSVCDGGLVIDLGLMNQVDVDATNRVARAAAGVRVGAFLKATQAQGLATPSGACPDVGIAGLTLGGGETALMARYGAVCDNVLSAQVVTADGRVLTASGRENKDLYWAIRGGSGNFGVVTSLEYRLHPVPDVLAGTYAFPLSRTRDVLRGYRDFMRSPPDELQTFGGLMPGPEGPVLAIAVTYCGDPGQGDHIIGTLRSALRPASGALERRPYSADFVSPPSATVGSGGFLPELDDRVIDVLAGHFEGAPVASTAMWNDYHGAVTRVGATEMAFPLREAGFDLFMSCTWKTPGQRKAADAWVTGFRQALRPFTRGVYVNSLDEEGDLRAREAYGPNYARLAEIKARYDPTNFFRLNQNIKPA